MRSAGESPRRDVAFRRARTMARVAALLWLASGALVAASALVFPGERASRGGVLVVAAVAVLVGAVVWFVPWDRLPSRSTLVLIPVACLVIAAFNAQDRDPWVSGLFFIVAFVWTGLAHPQGTSLVAAPLLLAAYLAPDYVRQDPGGTTSAAFLVPIAVVIGEATAWVATRLVAAEADLERAAARYAALVRHAGEFVVVIRHNRVVFASPGVRRVLGYDPDEVMERTPAELVHPDDMAALNPWLEDRAPGRVDLPATYRVRHADGSWRWVEGTFSDLRHDPAVEGIVVNGRDISERLADHERLENLALRDQLTGLVNRPAFLTKLEGMVAMARERQVPLALLFIDLDRFKVVNDSLGHALGDELLARVAARLREATPVGHVLGRIGGDEFVVLVPTDGCSTVMATADRLSEAVSAPVHLGGRRLVLGCSIGIELAVPTDASTFLRHADLALFRAKDLGRNRVVLFDDNLARQARRRLDVEAELRVGIESGQLRCFFQPEVDLRSGRMVGVEALVRWQHPVRGLLGPAEFLDVAEDTGLVVELGAVVLDEACAAAVRFRRLDPDFVVACNVSPSQLRSVSIIETVGRALLRHGLPGDAIRLEVTENMLVEPDARQHLEALRALGVGLAIDDFGTGYSSLSYLDRLAVDVLKIDQSFLAPVKTGEERLAVVEATLAMAASLQLHTVAEGVETPAQLHLLQRLGCPSAQGFLFGRPVPAEDVARDLVAGVPLHRPVQR